MPRFAPIVDERDEAEKAAVAALVFLTERPDDLARFLSISGIVASDIRRSAADPGFLSGVLDYLLSDEPLLVAFAAGHEMQPERVARLRAAFDDGRPVETWP